MNSHKKVLSALLSTLISQLTFLLLLIFPSSNQNFHRNIFPLIHHSLSTSEIVSALSLLSFSNKRKRTLYSEPDAPDEEDEPRSRIGQLARFDSVISAVKPDSFTKRKRTQFLDPDAPEDEDESGSRFGQRGRVDSVFPSNPDSFKLCFKMSSSTFEWLCGLLDPLLECRDPVDSPLNLSADTRLSIGLFRLATGADFPEISTRFRVSESVTKFCVKQLSRVLCTNFRFWVGFPCSNELETVSTQFETLTGMPNCCGIINCTRFKIIRRNWSNSISKDNLQEESIAAQIILDSSSKILSIIAGFRGDKSDSLVLKSSTLYGDVEGKRLLNSRPKSVDGVEVPQYLVGDVGYPLLPWLLVPFVDPKPESSEEDFNNAHRLMRLTGIKTIASLKNWGVLSRPIEVEFKTMVAYIGSCSILHNVLLMREDYSALCDGLDDDSLDDQSFQDCRDGSLKENSIEEGRAIRSVLATRAREFRASNHQMESGSSARLQQHL